MVVGDRVVIVSDDFTGEHGLVVYVDDVDEAILVSIDGHDELHDGGFLVHDGAAGSCWWFNEGELEKEKSE